MEPRNKNLSIANCVILEVYYAKMGFTGVNVRSTHDHHCNCDGVLSGLILGSYLTSVLFQLCRNITCILYAQCNTYDEFLSFKSPNLDLEGST